VELLGSRGVEEKEVEEAWEGLEEEELRVEVGKYEEALRSLARDLCDREVAFRPELVDFRGLNANSEGTANEDEVLGNVEDLDPSEWEVPSECVPIHTNVTLFDWKRLYDVEQFDVIMMDPPWQLATHNPTRGVALGYSQLTDRCVTLAAATTKN